MTAAAACEVKRFLSWAEVDQLVGALADKVSHPGWRNVYGIPRGGCVPAALLAGKLGLPLTDAPGADTLIVDDLVDSGQTFARHSAHQFVALLAKPWSPPEATVVKRVGPEWVVFPWEGDESGPTDAVVRLLTYLGEDPNRDGLADTPERVVRALGEMTAGYKVDPAKLLARRFEGQHYDEMIVVRDVEFTSLCEHHMLPFTGHATVGYVPAADGTIVGLSKLARLVDCFALRLQVQERLTCQIADAIQEHLTPRGVGVVVVAQHHCMACRGVRKRADMVTSSLLGVLRDDARARAEFLALANHG